MNERLEDIASLNVSPDETREILRRLADDEFGGAGMAKVQDLAEVSGVPVETIARIVAQIREESDLAWRQDVEAKIAKQERRLAAISRSEQWRSEQAAKMSIDLWERPRCQPIRFRPIKRRDFKFMLRALTVLTVLVGLIWLILATVYAIGA